MFFFRNNDEANEEEDNIEILISRLEHSEYLEDKYDALEELERYAKNHILETGSYGLSPIIYSIEELENIKVNLKILAMIFESKHGDEFVDLLLKNEENLQILMRNRRKDSEGFFKLINTLTLNRDFCKAFVKVKDVSHYCVQHTEIINRLMGLDNNFDKEIVFEGIFEKLILDCDNIELINTLLDNNHFNQNYFIETNWPKIVNGCFKLNNLVDNTNNNVNYIKDEVYKNYKFERAIENKDYEFIYRMIYGSTKYRKILKEIFMSEKIEDVLRVEKNEENLKNEILQGDKDEEVEQNENVDEAFHVENNENNDYVQNVSEVIILSYYFMHKDILKFESTGYIFLIYSELLYEPFEIPKLNIPKVKYDLIHDLVIQDVDRLSRLLLLYSFRNIEFDLSLSLEDISLQTIMYFIVLSSADYITKNSNILQEKIHDEDSDPAFKKLCILLCCMHGIKLSFSKNYLKENVKQIRKLIVNTGIDSPLYTIDETTSMVIDKLNELIDLYSAKYY